MFNNSFMNIDHYIWNIHTVLSPTVARIIQTIHSIGMFYFPMFQPQVILILFLLIGAFSYLINLAVNSIGIISYLLLIISFAKDVLPSMRKYSLFTFSRSLCMRASKLLLRLHLAVDFVWVACFLYQGLCFVILNVKFNFLSLRYKCAL